MRRRYNVIIFIIAIALVVGAIVLLVNNTFKGNDENKRNNEINTNNLNSLNTENEQNEENIVNPYVEKQEDGQIENNSPEIKEEKRFKQIKITNINFIYNPGNKMTTITADLKNEGTEEQTQEIVELKIKGQTGEEITTIEALIPNIKQGETKTLRCSATADLSNASNFEILEK